MRAIAAELLAITQQIRDRSVHCYATDEIATLDARREELHTLYDACERQQTFVHKYND
jgi:hypothetical protein